MTSPKWKLLLGVVAVLAATAIGVACGDDDDNGGKTTTSSATTAAATTASGGSPAASATTATANQPQKGGEVTVHALQFQSWDPHFSSFGSDISTMRMVWRGLYRLDKDNKLVPEMAASAPQISADSLTYTIKLKPSLKWSDGQPLTAKDFVAGILRTCDPAIAGDYQGSLANVVGCGDLAAAAKASDAEKTTLRGKVAAKALDDTTIEIKIKQPQATFATQLALWFTFPVPSHVVKSADDKWPDPTAVPYNGPFKVQSYKEKDSMVLVRNDNYAGNHAAYLDKVTLRIIEDTEQANNAFRNNELQFALANTANLDVIKSDPNLKSAYFQSPQSANTIGIHMNMTHKPLDNPKVRLALSQAIDRTTLNKIVFKEAFLPTTSWIPEALLGLPNNPFEKEIGFNADQAKKNLADAGFANGQNFPKLNFVIRDTPANKAQAEFIKNAYKTILNIDIDVQVVDTKTRSDRYKNEDFDLFPGGWNQDFPDPENWVDGLFDSKGPGNHYHCNSSELDDLFTKAKVNLNNEQRKTQYVRINEIISKDLCGTAVIYHQTNNYLIAAKLQGMREFSTSQDGVQAADWAIEEWWLKK